MSRYIQIAAGEPAPHFTQRSLSNPRYCFDTAAGRYLVLCFHHSAGAPAMQQVLASAIARTDIFDDRFASLFAVSTDPADETEARIANRLPGFRVILDHDLSVSRKYGAAADDDPTAPRRALWVVTDPTMRIIDVLPFDEAGNHVQRLIALLSSLPPPERFAGTPLQAPILYLPGVFEPDFCARLIATYDAKGGELSGFMRAVDGKTIGVHDASHKVRRDVTIDDAGMIAEIQHRILRRIVPEIAKIHQFHVTRMERYLVACYAADDGGHFNAHRDNTTPGTAHRRFAVSVNLNDAFEGGEVCFPEYGPQSFKAPAGGAVVFSCSLLHKVNKVTAGRRYAFLPFLYDDAAAKVRAANQSSLASEAGSA
jgi:predicted 2-oxoglutarate/Fe(II)-dependent dioxygenase YbiX/peroxiredoxin